MHVSMTPSEEADGAIVFALDIACGMPLENRGHSKLVLLHGNRYYTVFFTPIIKQRCMCAYRIQHCHTLDSHQLPRTIMKKKYQLRLQSVDLYAGKALETSTCVSRRHKAELWHAGGPVEAMQMQNTMLKECTP